MFPRNLTAVSWRSPHVSQRWRGCESKWSHAMYQALATHPARVSDIKDADVVFLDVETAQEVQRELEHLRARLATVQSDFGWHVLRVAEASYVPAEMPPEELKRTEGSIFASLCKAAEH